MNRSGEPSGDAQHTSGAPQQLGKFAALAFGSLGVVYGDIGTSPLYAFREAVLAAQGSGPLTRDIVLGVLSLIVWSLTLVIAIKYVLVLLRADNNGEGGTLSLTALAFRAFGQRTPTVLVLGILGASMFYGASLITPALSVLSAVEGLQVVTPAFEPYVLPITIVLLVGLFAVQSRGTERVSVLFAPVTAVWFVAISISGISHITDDLGIFVAINPVYALQFLASHGVVGLLTLGAVFLVVTGGEALYADLGHFGRKPIQSAWFFVVFPALLLNYFGQGALVLTNPDAISNPFYRLVPDGMLLPMVCLATAATVIASQAMITGAYSITRQAIQLGLLPRLEIRHTSATHHGQIYMPRVNIALLVGVLVLVALCRTSSALAAAYGLAVAMTMVMDGLLGLIVIRALWHWPNWAVGVLMFGFIAVDGTFLTATSLKLLDGAWLPVLFGMVVMFLILTWRRGTRILAEKSRRIEVPLDALLANLMRRPPLSAPGTAVFLTSDPAFAPTALMHNLKHNKVLHQQNVILTIRTTDTPRVSEEERIEIEQISPTFTRILLKFGYMETPNVPRALAKARKLGWSFDIMSTSFFLSRRSLKPAARSGMPLWQDRVFISLAKSASDASDFFHIPTDRVVEVGTQVSV